MEDEATEWENQGYEDDSGKVTRIWNKSFNVGKKILVTGFVISSAPLVLPPLMVISTLGLACAVPYGLFLASYACTEKLMTTLFPRPTTPFTYEELGTKDDDEKYGGGYVENEELLQRPTVPNTFEELGTKDEDDEKHGDVDVENEEEELKQRVEMRIEQDEKRNDSAKVDEKPPEKIHGVVIAIEGEDKKGSSVRAEEVPFEVTDVAEKRRVIAIEGEDKNGSNVREGEMPFEVTEVAVEVCERDNTKGNEELVRETRGLLEKIKDEGMFDGGVGKDKQSAEDKHEGAEEGLKKTDGNVQETVIPLGDTSAHGQRAQSAEDRHEDTQEGLKETDRHVQETVMPLGDTNAHGGRAQDTVDNHVKKELKLNTDTVDAREIGDESGSNLFVDIKAAHVQYSADNGTSEGSKQSSCVTVESLEITAPSRANAPESGGITSDEDLNSEEKMWKQIDAMRMIVGYTASRHATCIEELKALYVYTGVEPPASFKDPSDLVEINAKLRFLMSIIGVK